MKAMKTATLLLCVMALAALAGAQAVATPPAQPPLTLWGITMGQAPPVWATCPATATVEAQRAAGPCVQPAPPRHSWDLPAQPSPYTFVEVQNLPFAGDTLNITLYDKRVDDVGALVPEMLCVEVREALEKKLGKPAAHVALPMQNGYGATWTADMWTWTEADDTKVEYASHISEREGCVLHATTAANRQRNKPTQVVTP